VIGCSGRFPAPAASDRPQVDGDGNTAACTVVSIEYRHDTGERVLFSHIMIGANDVEASKRFYDAVLGALGHGPGVMDTRGRCFYRTSSGVFAITKPINGEAATHANGGTIGFLAANPEAANAWHAAGLENGGTTCEDPPGVRETTNGNLYLAYLRDPSGNKICALHRMA
jgi:catechol 2,3-dioxygenase-like lactoylglutathione lyase family enzyme